MSLLANKTRLVTEVNAMRSKYPGASFKIDAMEWHHTVEVMGRRFPIRIVYPPNYPVSGPRIFSVAPLPQCPHLLSGYELCWTDVYSANGHWRPEIHTAVVAMTEAYRWFANFLVWQSTGKWPTRSDH